MTHSRIAGGAVENEMTVRVSSSGVDVSIVAAAVAGDPLRQPRGLAALRGESRPFTAIDADTACYGRLRLKGETVHMATLLDQLNTMTVAVCDTGDLNSINKFKPRDA